MLIRGGGEEGREEEVKEREKDGKERRRGREEEKLHTEVTEGERRRLCLSLRLVTSPSLFPATNGAKE